MKNQIQVIANEIAVRLLKAGFKIQKYDSYSTSSVYLKLDYGTGNSIRIADHEGKKHLHYRYNLILNETGYRENLNGEYPMYFYGADMIEKLIQDILNNKATKIAKYKGIKSYKAIMVKSKNEKRSNRGFWEQAYEIALDTNDNIVRI